MNNVHVNLDKSSTITKV